MRKWRYREHGEAKSYSKEEENWIKMQDNARNIFVVCACVSVVRNWILQEEKNNTGHFDHLNLTTGQPIEITFQACNHAATSWKCFSLFLKSLKTQI